MNLFDPLIILGIAIVACMCVAGRIGIREFRGWLSGTKIGKEITDYFDQDSGPMIACWKCKSLRRLNTRYCPKCEAGAPPSVLR